MLAFFGKNVHNFKRGVKLGILFFMEVILDTIVTCQKGDDLIKDTTAAISPKARNKRRK